MSEPSIEQQLLRVAAETVYVRAEMIKFLLAENLALKSLLHEKGILTPEEFETHKKKAVETLELSMKSNIAQELRRVIENLKENERAAPK